MTDLLQFDLFPQPFIHHPTPKARLLSAALASRLPILCLDAAIVEFAVELMRQILFFAIAALVLAGVMPRVMGNVGKDPTPQTQQAAKRAEPAPQQAASYAP